MTRIEQLRKLAALQPSDPMIHYGIGLEYINHNQWSDAAAAFAKAIEVDPKYAAAFYHKARAEIADGATDTARATLELGMTTARNSGDWHTEGEMRALLETLS